MQYIKTLKEPTISFILCFALNFFLCDSDRFVQRILYSYSYGYEQQPWHVIVTSREEKFYNSFPFSFSRLLFNCCPIGHLIFCTFFSLSLSPYRMHIWIKMSVSNCCSFVDDCFFMNIKRKKSRLNGAVAWSEKEQFLFRFGHSSLPRQIQFCLRFSTEKRTRQPSKP